MLQKRFAKAIALFFVSGIALPACVSIYQPFSTLQRPVVVSLKNQNLKDLKIRLECQTSEYLTQVPANQLCEGVADLYTSQGATVVESLVSKEDANSPDSAAKKSYDLHVKLSARMLFAQFNAWMLVAAIPTFSLVPVQEEFAFEQQVSILTSTGFLVSSQSFQGRFIRYYGAGYFGVNFLLNWLSRDEADQIDEDRSKEAFSKDLFSHLVQLTFNAQHKLALLQDDGKVQK